MISREIRCNQTPAYDIYLPHKAREMVKNRRNLAGKRQRLKNPIISAYIIANLKRRWSPEQITGRLPIDHPGLSISYKAIYQYIYDKHSRKYDDLAIYLARTHKKRTMRSHSRKHRKSHILYSFSIENRPRYIEKLLNNRPRKCLNCKTPLDVSSSCVALAC